MSTHYIDGSPRRRLKALALCCALASFAPWASAIAPMPISGECGFVLSLQYPFAYLFGSNPGTGYGMNMLGTINYSTKTISANIVLQNPAAANTTTESQSAFSVPYTVSSGPVAGSYTLTFTAAANTLTINLIPVNGGNTALLQFFNPTAGGQNAGAAGVCQK